VNSLIVVNNQDTVVSFPDIWGRGAVHGILFIPSSPQFAGSLPYSDEVNNYGSVNTHVMILNSTGETTAFTDQHG
jgi:hypothetical protein